MDLKVVLSESGLHVVDPKNINISRTTQDMKKSKLGFCRIKFGLFCHAKILVNTCWPRMQKFTLKLKSSLKTCFFDDVDKMMGVLWNIVLLIMKRCLKHFLIMHFHQNPSMTSYLWNSWKKNFFRNFDFFQFFSYFYLQFYVYFFTIKRFFHSWSTSVDQIFCMTKKPRHYSTKP